jgi:hypothetical protein
VSGGLGKPLTREDVETMLLASGLTRQDLKHCERLNMLHKLGGDEAWRRCLSELTKARRRAEITFVRRLLSKLEQMS